MKDEMMQKIILRDQLLILVDKVIIMRNAMQEKNLVEVMLGVECR